MVVREHHDLFNAVVRRFPFAAHADADIYRTQEAKAFGFDNSTLISVSVIRRKFTFRGACRRTLLARRRALFVLLADARF